MGKQLVRIGLAIGTFISLFYVPWILIWAWVLPLPDSVKAQADEAIGHGLDGIIVYVDQAGNAPEFYAAGWHNRDKKIPADPHALFKIASISKLYDAVSITKLVANNQLSLDKTLADDFSAVWPNKAFSIGKPYTLHFDDHRSIFAL